MRKRPFSAQHCCTTATACGRSWLTTEWSHPTTPARALRHAVIRRKVLFGTQIAITYGTGGGIDDATSRVSQLVDSDGSSTVLAEHEYLGLGAIVGVDHPQPDLEYTLIDLNGTVDPDTGDIYSGLDRFGRIKDCR